MTMLVSLTPSTAGQEEGRQPRLPITDPSFVGGKGASLAKLYSIPSLRQYVPKSYVATVDFFQPWIQMLQDRFKDLTWNNMDFEKIQEQCQVLPLNDEQRSVIEELCQIMKDESFGSTTTRGIAAVRSSAPEEDGMDQSYAGAFVTKLGVTTKTLERAIRDCFASRFNPRVSSYMAKNNTSSSNTWSFAVIVMEMIDADVAGVAFTANPLNSDRDELVVNSSFGLGESVVDGSVSADRYIYQKVEHIIVDSKIGIKTQQRRLGKGGIGVETVAIEGPNRQSESSLLEKHLHQLAEVTSKIEDEYGIPMDVEWAFAEEKRDGNTQCRLKLLQARPITTLFYIDEVMMTRPGEKRILYYDYNIVSDATTTTPFTTMDLGFYGWASSAMMGFPDRDIFSEDPNMPMFRASTRQYCNLSIFLKYMTTDYCAKSAEIMDPYLASIFASTDCDEKKYKMKKLPKGVGIRSLWNLIRQIPFLKLYKIGKMAKKDPENASLQYQEIVEENRTKFKELQDRGPMLDEGFQAYAHELFEAMLPSFEKELGILYFVVLPLSKELDKQRREGKTEELRSEYEALCSGFEKDEVMKLNVAIYKLANLLDETVWEEYPHEDLVKLYQRIKQNLTGGEKNLPTEFLSAWANFLESYGWDGQDQLFPSSPRYKDDPVHLLAILRQNAGSTVKDPAELQKDQIVKRRRAMAFHEEQAKGLGCLKSSALSKIKNRNECLEHLMWIRNNPKLHLCQLCGIIREALLKVEADWLDKGRLEEKNDIFHVDLKEIDLGLQNTSFDLMNLVRPRKIVYERALLAKECPILVDSRCRILKPDPPNRQDEDLGEGTLIGSPISQGIATGRVRILHHPSEKFESGEILAAVVTSPAWTPLFAGAAGVVLQIGGVLQHGALCAREYGIPAVSNIDIHRELRTGMMVTLDGNTGTIRIQEDPE